MTFSSPEFWVMLLQVIGLNCVLSVDNAVAIALVARRLPLGQRPRAFVWGAAAALAMRIVLTIVALELLRLPYLKLVGAVLLLWIAVQLLLPEPEPGAAEAVSMSGLSRASAIKTIVLADLAMSLDNVIVVAAAAKGSTTLLIAGLAVSIPLVVFASTLLLKVMSHFPVIVTIGAALIGWVAGAMAITDSALKTWVDGHAAFLHSAAPALGALVAVGLGKLLAARAVAARRVAPP